MVPTTPIRPEDIAAEDAQKMLDFLNKATSPEEIASAVEIPGELDVGIKLGERILERRRQLGSFSDLQQVDDVKLIGPKRFSQMVRALTGAVSGLQDGQVDTGDVARLEREVAELRAAVDGLRAVHAPPRVTLRPLEASRFLGEPAQIVATVTDAAGLEPQVDVPVVFTASWGRLRATDGYTIQEGASVTARTNTAGTATVALTAPTSEDLLDVQQAALETALRTLDPNAKTPEEGREGLAQLTDQYAWEPNEALRGGVDVYFRDFRHLLLETVNFRDSLQEWSHFDSTVVAYVQDGPAGSAPDSFVRAAAALTVQLKDWLAPWLEVFVEVAEEASSLPDDLHGATRDETDPSALVDRLHGGIGDFLEGRQGVVGAYVANRIAQAAVQGYVTKTFDTLPVATRMAIFPALHATARTLQQSSGGAVVDAIHRSSGVLKGVLDSKVTELSSEIAAKIDSTGLENALASSALITNLTTQIGAKLDAHSLDTALAQSTLIQQISGGLVLPPPPPTSDTASIDDLASQIATKLDASALDDALGQSAVIDGIQTELGTKVDTAALDSTLTDKVDTATFETSLAEKVDAATLDSSLADTVDRATLDAALADKVDTATLDTALADKVDTATFETSLAEKVDAATLDSALANTVDRATLESALAGKADSATVETELAGKVDAAGLESALAGTVDRETLDTALAGKADATAVDTALAGKVDAAALDTAVAGKVDAAAFDEALAGKVDAAAFDKALADKVDAAAFGKGLAGKVDTATFNTALASKVDAATFNTALASKVDTVTFDTALASKVDAIDLTRALATKVDTAVFTSALAAKVDTATFSNALAKKVDTVTFTNALALKADTSALTTLQTQLPGRIRIGP